MVQIDLDVDGLGVIQQELQRLEEEWDDPPVFAVGSNVEYAVYLEFGVGARGAANSISVGFDLPGGGGYSMDIQGFPPYPWLRPAVREARANPRAFVRKNTGQSLSDADSADELIRLLANALETQCKKNVTAQASGGRSPGTHPNHPKVVTGNLRASIRAKKI